MVVPILITFFLVFLNGFFVAAEFAIVKVRTSQIDIRVKKGSRLARITKHIITHLDAYLSATQLGITFASLGLGWIGEPVVSKIILSLFHFMGLSLGEDIAESIALPVAFIFITIMHIVFGELAPKSLAIQRALVTSLVVAIPLRIFYNLFFPIVWILNGFSNFILKIIGITPLKESAIHSPEELRLLLEETKKVGNIEPSKYEILKNAFDFPEVSTRQIMIPRHKVFAIEVTVIPENVIDNIFESGYSRIPVFEGTIDHIIGILYTKDLLGLIRKENRIEIVRILRPISFVPGNKKIIDLLHTMQTEHIQMVVVVDEYGGTEGIVTMEDIIEELVGEIQDELDTENPIVEKTGEITYKVIATSRLNEINNLLPRPLAPDEEFITLAGQIIRKSGRIPDMYDSIIMDDYEITVLKKIKNSIHLVKLKDLKPSGEIVGGIQ